MPMNIDSDPLILVIIYSYITVHTSSSIRRVLINTLIVYRGSDVPYRVQDATEHKSWSY
jgi:hypothetical protein